MSSFKELYLPQLNFQKLDLLEIKSFHCEDENNCCLTPDSSKTEYTDSPQEDLLEFKELGFEESKNTPNKELNNMKFPSNSYSSDNSDEENENAGDCHNMNSLVIGHQIVTQLKGLKDIAGLEEVKQSLREAIVYPTKYPQLFKNGRTVWSRALLYGAPGVGKTTIAQAIAAEAMIPLYQVTSADLTSPWIGKTEKTIRKIFTTLGHKRCILFLDEVDSLCKIRSSFDTNHSRHMTTELLIQIQNYEGSAMFILCATNCPWDIDPAFLRRFQKIIYVPLPDIAARETLILNNIERNLSFNEGWKEFLMATNNLTGSDIKNIANSAMMIPLREIETAAYWKETDDGKMTPCDMNDPKAIRCKLDSIPNWKVSCRSLTMKDLWMALKKSDKSLTEMDLKRFTEFKKEHAI